MNGADQILSRDAGRTLSFGSCFYISMFGLRFVLNLMGLTRGIGENI